MKRQEAFEYMLKLINTGFEFPDAQWAASNKFHVPSELLAEMYDQNNG